MTARQWLVLAGLLLVSYAWFYPAGGWNQNSRFALIQAVVEQGTIRIDDYHAATGDKSVFEGHFYSDKAPGQAFLAVPVVWAAQPMVKSVEGQSYLATLLTAGVPTVLAALALAWAAIRLGASRGAALFAALVYGLGTPAWAYATLLWGHQLSACGLIAGFALAIALLEEGSVRRDWLLSMAVGLSAGWAVVTEYPALPAAAILAGLAVASARGGGRARMLRVAAGVALGALPCALVLMAYHAAAFGSPFETPLKHLWGFSHVREDPFSLPSASALHAILLGAKRGLLPLAPVLLVATGGLVLGIARGPRLAWSAAGAIVLAYLILNASFRTPLAGWSYGPRYLAGALPFLCLGLAPLFTWASVRLRVLMAGLAAIGAALALMAVSTTPQPPESIDRPVAELLWPAFRAGNLSLNHQSFSEAGAEPALLLSRARGRDAWNLGERLGLGGHASLVPLVAMWLIAGWWLWRQTRSRCGGPSGAHRPAGRSGKPR